VGQNNIIELNGRKYDAITGAMLGESKIKATPVSRATLSHRGRAMDGVIRKPHAAAPHIIKPTPVAAPKTAAPVAKPAHITSAKKMDISRPSGVPAKKVTGQKQQRSQTLMRHVVKKPQVQMKPKIKPTAPSEVMAKPKSELAKQLEKKVSVTQVNPSRLARAGHVSRSHHIRRYAQDRRPQVAPHANATPVARTAAHYTSAVRPAAAFRGQAAAHPQQLQQGAKASRSVALERAAKSLAAKQQAADMFEQALIHATSHEEQHHKSSGARARRHRRLASAFAGVGAFLVIIGFVAYLNKPAIELHFASATAGFHAELPSYKPTGYALKGGIQSESGRVAMTYKSGDSSYTITQTASDWNSATLLDQNTDQRGAPTRTVQSEGRIIYIYDNSASWVNSGVRYEVNGDAQLSTDDLVSLATSM
jgi:hypothetical protein